jgi:hypothetical protein
MIGEQPRPRVLALGVSPDDPFVSGLRRLAPTVHVLRQYVGEVRPEEWDALISVGLPPFNIPPHLFMLAAVPLGKVEEFGTPDGAETHVKIVSKGEHICAYLENPIVLGLDDEVSRLVVERLIPIVQRRASHQYFEAEPTFSVDPMRARRTADAWLRPLLRADSGKLLAATYRRGIDGGQAWLLPEDVGDLLPWAMAALRSWNRQDLVRFPIAPGWEADTQWQTPEERATKAQLTKLRQERAEVVQEFDKREKALVDQLAAASEQADRQDRAILTERGGSLVAVVARFLRELDFEVEEMDEQRPSGDKLEDLRVRVSEDPNWIALAEIRAYGGGAHANDLQRIARFALRHTQEHGVPPTARWYVVSQFVGQDPASRPSPLSTNPDDLRTFAEDRGLIIDTATLFRLVLAVRLGQLDASSARTLLRSAVGAFEFSDSRPVALD